MTLIMIKDCKLHYLVVNPFISSHFITEDNCWKYGTINPTYEEWKVQHKSYLLGCNSHNLKTLSPVFFMLFTLTKFGSIFMNIFSLK